MVETDSHGVDGEVAAVLVILEGTVLHMGLAAVVTVAFLACSHKLHLKRTAFDLGRAKVAEHRQVGLASQHGLQA